MYDKNDRVSKDTDNKQEYFWKIELNREADDIMLFDGQRKRKDISEHYVCLKDMLKV